MGGIGPRQEFIDAAVGMAVDDLGDHVSEVGVRVDAGELAGFDQRSDDGPVFPATIGTSEQRILPVQRDGSDAAFHYIGIDLDAAVVEEAGEAVPARQRIADRFSELGLLADQGELGTQPGSNSSMINRLLSWRTARRSSAPRPRMSLAIGAGPAAAS